MESIKNSRMAIWLVISIPLFLIVAFTSPQTGDRPMTALGQRLAAIRAAYGGKRLTPRELDKVVRERRSD